VGSSGKRARLDVRGAELRHGKGAPEAAAAEEQYQEVKRAAAEENARLGERIRELNQENQRYQMVLTTADGQTRKLPVGDVVRAYPANQLGFWDKLGVYLSRWGEYLWDDPRNSNQGGGIFPALWGTVVMTILMSLAVVPFGVLAALYMREYAKAGPLISAVRIAVNNLAGVPSIVFGVFGLGFFCYLIGAQVIDPTFFP